MANKRFQLEVQFTLHELDENGRPQYNGRFEMRDTQQLGTLDFPQVLEVMANLHTAYENIGRVTGCAETGTNG